MSSTQMSLSQEKHMTYAYYVFTEYYFDNLVSLLTFIIITCCFTHIGATFDREGYIVPQPLHVSLV